MDSRSRYPGSNLGLPANLSNHLACFQLGNIISSPVRRLIVHYERVAAVIEMLRNHVKYHQGKGETIMAKKLHVDIGRPKDIRIEVVAAQESGRARAT